MWSTRIVESRLAEQLVREGWATEEELRQVADGRRGWTQTPGTMLPERHGDLLARA